MMPHQLGNERPMTPADQRSRGSGRSSGARSTSNPPPPPQSPPPSDSESVASSGARSNQSNDSTRRARTNEPNRGPPVYVSAENPASQVMQRLSAAHRQARNAHYPDRQLAEKRMEQDLTPSTREMVDYITSCTNHQPGEQAPHYKDVISNVIANCPQCRSQRNIQGCQELGIDTNTMNCQAQEQQHCAACQLPVSRNAVPECDSCRASYHPACGKFKRVDEGYDTLKDADGEKIQSPKVCEHCRGVHRHRNSEPDDHVHHSRRQRIHTPPEPENKSTIQYTVKPPPRPANAGDQGPVASSVAATVPVAMAIHSTVTATPTATIETTPLNRR
jgi:hypothetical protein